MLFHKSKGIIIVGCSPFGAALANTLYNKGHKVVVLDKDRESFRYLPDGFGGAEMEGDPTDPKVLKEAGIERAGMFIAATKDDNSNLLISQIASRIFQVNQVYARLDDTSRSRLIRDTPIKPICVYNLSVDDYLNLAESVCQEVAV